MKRTSLHRLALCTLAASVAFPSSLALAQDSRATLSALIDPNQESVANDGAETDLINEVGSLLWRQRNYDTLWHLGEAAVPALIELTRSGPLEKLISSEHTLSPFYWLSEIAPGAALETQRHLSKSDPERFRLIVRRGFGPLGPYEIHHERGFVERTWKSPAPTLLAQGHAFLEAALLDPELLVDQKLVVAARAYELGVSTEGASRLIEANLKAAAPHLGKKGLRHFALKGLPEVPSDLEEALAQPVLDRLEPSMTVPPLTHSPHARVRAEAFSKLGDDKFDRSKAIALLVANIDEPSPLVQDWMLRIMDQSRLPRESEATLELLIPLMEFALRHQSSRGSVSERLGKVAMYLVSQANPDDASLVSQLVHAMYSADRPPIYLHFATSNVAYQIRSIAIAQAIVSGASGTLHQPDALIERIANHWIDSEKIETHQESASLLYSIYASFEPSDHKATLPREKAYLAALPAEDAPGALAWLGRADSRYDVIAAVSPSHWTGAMEALRASAFGEDRPWRERCIAMVALLYQPEVASDDISRIAMQLAAGFKTPDARDLFFTIYSLASSRGDAPLSHAWNRVVEALLASPDVSRETANLLDLAGAPRTGEELAVISRVLGLAAERIEPTTHSAQFTRLVSTATREEMTRGTAEGRLIPDKLLIHWIDHVLPTMNVHRDDLMGVILLRDDPTLSERALVALSHQVRAISNSTARLSLVNDILQLPGQSSARILTALTPQHLTSNERDTVLSKIAARRDAQVLQAKLLADVPNAAPTRESALTQVLALLEDDREAVRIEAIRGIGTLGAVEELPRLIRLVGSGSEAEQIAARETLDLLHRMAVSR